MGTWSRKKKLAATGGAIAAVLVVGGIAANSGDAPTEAEQAPAAVQTTPADPAPAAPAPEAPAEKPDPAPAESSEPSFGVPYEWDNGLKVTVSEPRVFRPGQYAAGAEGPGTAVRFTVTVENGTGKPYDPTLDYITVQSGESEADQIFDSANGLDGGPSTKLLPGRKVVYDVGFQVQKPRDVVMEFQPGDWSMDSVLFVS